jgi:hypothetical protein
LGSAVKAGRLAQADENVNRLGKCLLKQGLQALQQTIDFGPLKLRLAFTRHREQLSDKELPALPFL